eukprot:CAMPEP_0195640256 /NCGR_PEP_ID=MMETSP0815-20121206/26053_1 /TAXON_ID=97485 /ORGANISM="Prymnesium parvum, Strain Texoma1" /LENGTH=51 /DNA_ID=CAMNT_0040782915 /DNA_START=367 /DNA_END=522 /DNA_ORIENTATION=+
MRPTRSSVPASLILEAYLAKSFNPNLRSGSTWAQRAVVCSSCVDDCGGTLR